VSANCRAGDDGNLAGEFTEPTGVAVDPSGRIYVADRALNHVQRLDPAGNFEATLLGAGGGFFSPGGVATDAAGNVYVADTGNRRIQKFNSAGGFDRMWGWDVRDDGDSEANVFDVCTAADAGMALCRPAINTGTGPGGELGFPLGLAVDGAGNVYVADRDYHRIQRFTAAGTFALTWGKNVLSGGGDGFHEVCTQAQTCQMGSAATGFGGELDDPAAVAADAIGNVYAADTDNARVQRFGSGGNFISAWGRDVVGGGTAGYEVCTSAPSCTVGLLGGSGGEFNVPTGAAATAAGAVYFSDGGLQRIQKFAADPAPPAAVPPTAGVPAGPTGQRAAALKRCKKKKTKKARRKCRRKARQLPL
jgi:tripartite motif-containing protein 71